METGLDFEGLFYEDEIGALLENDKAQRDILSFLDDQLLSDELDHLMKVDTPKAFFVRPVMRVHDVKILEQALSATGIADRGKALIELCEVYLAQNHPA